MSGRPVHRQPSDRCILLVDDSEMIRILYRKVLRDAGYKVLVAKNGADALRIADGPEVIDLVMSDYQMPGMSGMDVLKWFNQHRPGLPLMLISASPEHLERAAGEAPYARRLDKTSNPDELLTAIECLLDQR